MMDVFFQKCREYFFGSFFIITCKSSERLELDDVFFIIVNVWMHVWILFLAEGNIYGFI